jgi:mRNA interferase RelE/StbE
VVWSYTIEPRADRELKRLGPAATAKIVGFLEKRIHGTRDPRAFGKPLSGSLHGLWRYRVEDYRIICRIEDHRVIVTVVAVGHRSSVYD